MWIERTTYSTAYKLPGILRWFEVKSVSTVSREQSVGQSGEQPEGSLCSPLINVICPLKPFGRWWSVWRCASAVLPPAASRGPRSIPAAVELQRIASQRKTPGSGLLILLQQNYTDCCAANELTGGPTAAE